MLRASIYRAKRLIHRRPALYGAAYSLATANLDFLRLRLQADQYPSPFGGLWTDRRDFPQRLEAGRARGEISDAQATQLLRWRSQGFLTLRAAIDEPRIDRYQAELDRLKSACPSPLSVTSISLPEPVPYSRQVEAENYSVRTVDDYYFSEPARRILMRPPITDFLELVFEKPPVLTQSLHFEYGSQQAVHQDTAFVRMNSPMRLVGVWIALEDVQPGSGELVYYPGSHHWPDYLFSGRFKHYDQERDGADQLEHWYRWLDEEGERRGSSRQSFLPRKGDILFWHAGLAHGGAAITRPGTTRRSLVGHYCPEGVRPLYHYYKPGQRKRRNWENYSYYSAYYR